MSEEEKKALEIETQKKIDEATATLKAELEKKDLDLKALQDKDLNFGKLRNQTAEEIKKAEDAKKAKETEVETLSKKVAEMEENISNSAEERKGRLVSAYAGKDEELKKNILFHFDRVKGAATTDAEIESAMKDAYVLSTGGRVDQDVIRQVQGSVSSGSRTVVRPADSDVSPETKAAAEEFNKYGAGIKPEDLTNPKYKVKPGQSAESNYTF